MKTASDPRHQKRVSRVQALFSYTYHPEVSGVEDILKVLAEIDDLIKKAAPEWPISQISRVDLSILREATYALLYEKTTPPKVILDEAIEIGKTYGTDSTPSFVNGVLGTILKTTKKLKDIN